MTEVTAGEGQVADKSAAYYLIATAGNQGVNHWGEDGKPHPQLGFRSLDRDSWKPSTCEKGRAVVSLQQEAMQNSEVRRDTWSLQASGMTGRPECMNTLGPSCRLAEPSIR